jgi:membrane fusion protein, multidrug efflux system
MSESSDHQETLPNIEDLPDIPVKEGCTKTGAGCGTAVLLLLLAGGITGYLAKTKKLPVAEATTQTAPAIETAEVEAGHFRPKLLSQGILEPIIQTSAKAEVAGKIVWVCPKWHAGENFSPDEVLLKLDPADYNAALAQAKAREAEARVTLELAKAKGEQAKRDWQKLNPGQQPDNVLVLQQPQIAAAQTAVEAATAGVAKAERDLDRTQLKAPYGGRLERTLVNLGTFVSPGTPLADFYSTERYQIRLPLSPEDAALLDVRGKLEIQQQGRAIPAAVVRTEGTIDRQTRSVIVVAEITTTADLMPGAYFTAELPATPLQGLLRLPRKCLREDAYVWTVDQANKLQKQAVETVRREQDAIYFKVGPAAKTAVLSSVLPVTTEGMVVQPTRPQG